LSETGGNKNRQGAIRCNRVCASFGLKGARNHQTGQLFGIF
jgi:hypothetical protein